MILIRWSEPMSGAAAPYQVGGRNVLAAPSIFPQQE